MASFEDSWDGMRRIEPTDEQLTRSVVEYGLAHLAWRPARSLSCALGNPRVRLANLADIAERDRKAGAGTVLLAATPLVEITPDGSGLMAMPHHGIPLDEELRRRHILGVGMTGSGKTAVFGFNFLTSLLASTEDSLVINNLKGARHTEAIRALVERFSAGTEVIVFSPANALRSIACNFLAVARRHGMSSDLIDLLANVVREGRDGTNFWAQSTKQKLQVLLDLPELEGLAHVHEILKDPVLMREVAEALASAELNALLRFESSGSNGETSRMNDAGCLEPFSKTAAIRAVCSGADELDPIELVCSGRRFVLVLEADEIAQRSASICIAFLFELIFRGVLRACDANAGRLPRPLTFFFDEAGSLYLPSLPQAVNLQRERRVSFVCLVQTLGQLQSMYGDEYTSLNSGFSTTIWFGGHLSVADAIDASIRTGKIWVADSSTTQTDAGSLGGGAESRTWANRERPLVSVDDLRTDQRHPVFGGSVYVLPSVGPPILCHITPSWELPAVEAAMSAGELNAARIREEPLPFVPQKGLVDVTRFSSVHPALTIAGRPMTQREMERAADGIRPRVKWPKPPQVRSPNPPWCERFELRNGIDKVLLVMQKLDMRRVTVAELENAMRRAGSDDPDDGVLQIDIDTIRAPTVRKAE